jgi:antirestriction protein
METVENTLTEDQKEALSNTGVNIPLDVAEEYADQTGDTDFSDLEESYSGQHDSDEDFARYMAEETGTMPNSTAWPHYCIDWEYAARELMMDYTNIMGYYFRQL